MFHRVWIFLAALDCQTVQGATDGQIDENSMSNGDILFYDGSLAIKKKRAHHKRFFFFRRIPKVHSHDLPSRSSTGQPSKQPLTVVASARTIDTTHNSSFGSNMTAEVAIAPLQTVQEESMRVILPESILNRPRLASIMSLRTFESSVMDMTDRPEGSNMAGESSLVAYSASQSSSHVLHTSASSTWTSVSSMLSLFSSVSEEEDDECITVVESPVPLVSPILSDPPSPAQDIIRFGDYDVDDDYSTTSSSIQRSNYLSASYLPPQHSSLPRHMLLAQSSGWTSSSSLSSLGTTDSSEVSSITMLSREQLERHLESVVPGRIFMNGSHTKAATKIAAKIRKLRQRISKKNQLLQHEDDTLSMRGVVTYVGGSMDPSKCLILLLDPRKRTYDIVNVNYESGCRVRDLIDQIPLQNSSDFGLRFQRYKGLVHGNIALYSKEPLKKLSDMDEAVPEQYCLRYQEQEFPLVAVPDGYTPAQAHALARIVLSSPSPSGSLNAYQAFQEMQDFLLSGLEF